jgi:hypothetical protein
MEAAMVEPDCEGWHGFYDCKKRYNNLMEEDRGIRDGYSYIDVMPTRP